MFRSIHRVIRHEKTRLAGRVSGEESVPGAATGGGYEPRHRGLACLRYGVVMRVDRGSYGEGARLYPGQFMAKARQPVMMLDFAR